MLCGPTYSEVNVSSLNPKLLHSTSFWDIQETTVSVSTESLERRQPVYLDNKGTSIEWSFHILFPIRSLFLTEHMEIHLVRWFLLNIININTELKHTDFSIFNRNYNLSLTSNPIAQTPIGQDIGFRNYISTITYFFKANKLYINAFCS